MIRAPCSGRAELSTQTEEVRGGHREVGEHLKWSWGERRNRVQDEAVEGEPRGGVNPKDRLLFILLSV